MQSRSLTKVVAVSVRAAFASGVVLLVLEAVAFSQWAWSGALSLIFACNNSSYEGRSAFNVLQGYFRTVTNEGGVAQAVVENRMNKKNFPPSRTSWPEKLFCPSCDGVRLPLDFLAVSTINDDLKCCH